MIIVLPPKATPHPCAVVNFVTVTVTEDNGIVSVGNVNGGVFDKIVAVAKLERRHLSSPPLFG
jgi:hypothetical protein